MREITVFPPRKLREQIIGIRPHAASGPLYAVFTACKVLGDDVASVRLYSMDGAGGSLLHQGPPTQVLALPPAGTAIMQARHVRLIRGMLRRYGRIGVELCGVPVTRAVAEI